MSTTVFVLLVVSAFAVLAFAVMVASFWGRFFPPKCPKCGKRGNYAPTGQQRTTTASSGAITAYDEYQCSDCGHTEWKKAWGSGIRTRGGPY